MNLTNRKFTLPALFLTAIVSVVLAFGATNPNPEMQSSFTPTTDTVPSIPVKESALTSFVTTSSAVAEGEADDARVALLTIRPTGFDPKEITMPAGKYLVVVRNRTGLDQFSVRLERSNGARLYDVRLPRYKREWKQFLHLVPDTYVITETNHPDWVCRITVSAG